MELQIGATYKINYRNRDYVKIATGPILGQDHHFVTIRDKFGDILVLNKNAIIEAKLINDGIITNEETKDGDSGA